MYFLDYDDKTDKIYKLEKKMYGPRENSRAWYERFDGYIQKLGFKRSLSDYCLYIKFENNETIYLILHIDDLLICGKSMRKINKIKNELLNKFSMKDLGEVKTY